MGFSLSSVTAGSPFKPVWPYGKWNGKASPSVLSLQSYSLSEVGLAVNSVCHFPFWSFMTNLRKNSSWFSNPPFAGVGKESSGNATVLFIWFSICAIPVDDSIIVLKKEFRRSKLMLNHETNISLSGTIHTAHANHGWLDKLELGLSNHP
jgi:hypothetical protein